MISLLLRVIAFALTGVLAGCTHLDISSPGEVDRVLRGTVTAPTALPAGTEVIVRLVDMTPAGIARADLPMTDRPMAVPAERVLGEFRQTLPAMQAEPLPFELSYRADDSELRRGVNIDVRISFGGRLRFRTISAHVLTLASSPFPQDVAVQAID